MKLQPVRFPLGPPTVFVLLTISSVFFGCADGNTPSIDASDAGDTNYDAGFADAGDISLPKIETGEQNAKSGRRLDHPTVPMAAWDEPCVGSVFNGSVCFDRTSDSLFYCGCPEVVGSAVCEPDVRVWRPSSECGLEGETCEQATPMSHCRPGNDQLYCICDSFHDPDGCDEYPRRGFWTSRGCGGCFVE